MTTTREAAEKMKDVRPVFPHSFEAATGSGGWILADSDDAIRVGES